MHDLIGYQYGLIAIVFLWSGFVRSGLGFGGAVFSLPFLLWIINDPLIWLPIISVHLLFFSALTIFQNYKKTHASKATLTDHTAHGTTSLANTQSSINWPYLRYALSIMIVPKLIGVFGLISLPANFLSAIIFLIITVYAITYIFNISFTSNNKTLDVIFLMLGGYISGTSLIGAPLIIAVLIKHIDRRQLRDTLFALWFILVTIKMSTFIYLKIDLQLIHHLWLLPSTAIGHMIGMRFHNKMLNVEPVTFYRVLGFALLSISLIGLIRLINQL